MILGIGTDIIEIDRIKKAIINTPKFLDKLFTERELKQFNLDNQERNFIPICSHNLMVICEKICLWLHIHYLLFFGLLEAGLMFLDLKHN